MRFLYSENAWYREQQLGHHEVPETKRLYCVANPEFSGVPVAQGKRGLIRRKPQLGSASFRPSDPNLARPSKLPCFRREQEIGQSCLTINARRQTVHLPES